MFSIDPLWVYIAVPAVLVSILVVIKLAQREMNKIPASEFPSEEKEIRTSEEETRQENLAKTVTEAEAMQTQPEALAEKVKPRGCSNYLGYLFMKKAPNETHIPDECYNCPNLLKCLYSPVVVEKVYGE